jgi:hypothetical protein
MPRQTALERFRRRSKISELHRRHDEPQTGSHHITNAISFINITYHLRVGDRRRSCSQQRTSHSKEDGRQDTCVAPLTSLPMVNHDITWASYPSLFTVTKELASHIPSLDVHRPTLSALHHLQAYLHLASTILTVPPTINRPSTSLDSSHQHPDPKRTHRSKLTSQPRSARLPLVWSNTVKTLPLWLQFSLLASCQCTLVRVSDRDTYSQR